MEPFVCLTKHQCLFHGMMNSCPASSRTCRPLAVDEPCVPTVCMAGQFYKYSVTIQKCPWS